MNVQSHNPEDIAQLRQRIDGEHNAQQRDRYRAVLLALEDDLTESIAQTLGRSRRFVQRWVYAYRDHGIEAIGAKPRGGSKPKLDPHQQQQFIERFKAGPTQADGGSCTLRGKDGQRIAQLEYGVNYSLNGVYKLLHRHGLSCLKPRPKHRKQDPQAQQQWLDDAPLLSKTPSGKSPKNKSKSGSRMKHALANKAR